jgi:hypothetical protein
MYYRSPLPTLNREEERTPNLPTRKDRPEIMPYCIKRKREKETSRQMAGANPKEV